MWLILENIEQRLLERMRIQSEGNRFVTDAHACVLQRQYAGELI